MTGFRVFNENGSEQVGTQGFSLALSSSSNITLVDDGMTHPQPMVAARLDITGVNPIFAFLPGSTPINVTRVSSSGSNFSFYLTAKSGSPINVAYWVFDVPVRGIKSPGMSTAGLRVYDQFGSLTFDAADSVFRIVGYLGPTMPNPAGPGREQLYPTEEQILVPAGRTYAVVQSLFGWANTMWATGQYSNYPGGIEELPEGDPGPPPPGSQYKFMQLESYYSAAYKSGSTIGAGLFQFELWRGWYPINQNEHVNTYGQLGHTVIDVTDFIGGGTSNPSVVNVSVNPTTGTASGPAGSTTISNTVTASASGGSGTGYTYEWNYVSGSTAIVPYTSTTVAGFRTKLSNQTSGTTYNAVWRATVTDSAGNVGVGPSVTFSHTAAASDPNLDTVDWANCSFITDDNIGAGSNLAKIISGINQTVNLRFTLTSITHNFDGGDFYIYKNGVKSRGANGFGLDYWTDVDVVNGDSVYFYYDGVTLTGRKTLNGTIEVRNMTTNTVVDTFTIQGTLDNNNDWNISDPTPNAVNWDNINGSSGDLSFFMSGNTQTIAGINQGITLRATITGLTGSNIVSSSRLDMLVNGAKVHDSSGLGNGYWTGNPTPITNNQSVYFIAHLGASNSGIAANASYTVTVRNLSDTTTDPAGAILDTFTVVQSANGPDQTPDPISWPNQIWSTPNESAGGAYSANGPTITGINRTTRLRFQLSGVSNNLTSSSWAVTNIQGASHTDLANSLPVSNGSFVDLDIVNGTNLTFKITGATDALKGSRAATGSVTVTNQSTGGTNLGSFSFGLTVDNDNSTDLTPTAFSFSNTSVSTASEYVQAWPGNITITGISQPITIRAVISNVSGNLTNGGLYIMKNHAAVGTYDYWLGGSASRSATYANGDIFSVVVDGSTTSGIRTGQCLVTIINDSTGATLTQYWTTITVDNDDNYNVIRNTPNPISVSDLSLYTNEPSGLTNASFFQITGINQQITIRFTRGNQWDSGGIFTRRLFIYHSKVGSGGPWTEYFIGTGAQTVADIAVTNGDWFYVQAYCDTTAGRGQTSFTGYVTNATTGASMATYSVTATVDADNNYGVAPLSVTVNNPYSYIADFTTPGQFYGVGDYSNATVSGGTAPYTYKWTRVAGPVLSVNSTALNPYFSYTATTNWNIYSEYQLEVTDSFGTKAYGSFAADWSAGNIQN